MAFLRLATNSGDSGASFRIHISHVHSLEEDKSFQAWTSGEAKAIAIRFKRRKHEANKEEGILSKVFVSFRNHSQVLEGERLDHPG